MISSRCSSNECPPSRCGPKKPSSRRETHSRKPLLSDNNSSRYRQLELPIRKEIFGRCRKDVVTSASHYSWCRRKVMLSTSLAVLSDSTGCTGYAETKRSTRLEKREEG